MSSFAEFAHAATSSLWERSWQTTVVLVLVAALIFAGRRRIAPRWQFLLWTLVLIRLALPSSLESRASVFNLLRGGQVSDIEIVADSTNGQPGSADAPELEGPRQLTTSSAAAAESPPEIQELPVVATNDTSTIATHGDSPGASSKPPAMSSSVQQTATREFAAAEWLCGVWLVGTTFFLLKLAFGWLSLRRLLSNSDQLSEPSAQNALRRCLEQHPILSALLQPELRLVNGGTVPFLAGIFRPKICLSAATLNQVNDEGVAGAVQHELAHVRRWDVLSQSVALIVRAVFWFHPASWIAVRGMQQARESACDDIVTRECSREQRQAYARALMTLGGHPMPAAPAAANSCGMTTRPAPLAVRVRRVMSGAVESRWGSIVGVLIVVGGVCCGLTDAKPPAVPAVPSTALESQQDDPPSVRFAFHNAPDMSIQVTFVGDKPEQVTTGITATLFRYSGQFADVTRIAETTSDEDGVCRFEKLPEAQSARWGEPKYVVTFKHPECRAQATSIDSPFHSVSRWSAPFRGTSHAEGRLVDHTGQPLAGARVEGSHAVPPDLFDLPFTTTDDDGRYELFGLPLKTYNGKPVVAHRLTFTHPDIPAFTREIKIISDDDVVAPAPATVAGSVVHEFQGNAITGIRVTAIPFDSRVGAEASAVTGDDGSYRLLLLEGKYKLYLDSPDLVAAGQILAAKAGTVTQAKPLKAQEGGWVIGQVIHTRTGQPMVYVPKQYHRDRPPYRIAIGYHGPGKPRGGTIYQENIVVVDDEGRFRMRLYPGANHPYFCNIHGNRTVWNRDAEMVTVKRGEETTVEMTFTPEPTDAEKMDVGRKALSALPKDTGPRVDAILAEFRKLSHTVDECETWCLMMKELVDIGSPAVPAICRELEQTDKPKTIRRLCFALRAIGDARAVPSLIRTIPRTLLPSASDYGLMVADDDLAAFMRQHQLRPNEGNGQRFSFSRAVREHRAALYRLTEHGSLETPLSRVRHSKDSRRFAAAQKQFYDDAKSWAEWWEANWKSFDVGAEYSRVNLAIPEVADVDATPRGLTVTPQAELDGGLHRMVLTPIGDADKGASFTLDLDLGGHNKLPRHLREGDGSPDSVAAVRTWAGKNGADLICVPHLQPDGTTSYALSGIGLKLWEIDPFDAREIESFLKSGTLPSKHGVEGDLLLHNPEKGRPVSQIGSSFLYLTQDDSLGIITITDFVTIVRDITGSFSAPKGVGFHRGVRFNWDPIAR